MFDKNILLYILLYFITLSQHPIFLHSTFQTENVLSFPLQPLRAALASHFYGNLGIEESDIFVSDGAKCDISRLQVRFSLSWGYSS